MYLFVFKELHHGGQDEELAAADKTIPGLRPLLQKALPYLGLLPIVFNYELLDAELLAREDKV